MRRRHMARRMQLALQFRDRPAVPVCMSVMRRIFIHTLKNGRWNRILIIDLRTAGGTHRNTVFKECCCSH